MRTNFTPEQLRDADTAEADRILRTCVHCGFCTATCPTYVLLGDELDSPRGRIYLIKEMLEQNAPATPEVVKHIDRCLSCLSCMTTCPSGVHYMHLVDHARTYIENTYRRPLPERLFRAVLAWTLPYPNRMRLSMRAAGLLKRVLRFGTPAASRAAAERRVHERVTLGRGSRLVARTRAMIGLAPSIVPERSDVALPRVHPAQGQRRGRVALLSGCVQQVMGAEINAATIRLLMRHGVEVVVAEGEGCCGALMHHLGRTDESHGFAKRNIDAWLRANAQDELDAILITASGCGTMIKDYGFLLREDEDYAVKAAEISAKTMDVSEYLARMDLSFSDDARPVVAYHPACSLQHGQRIVRQPKDLLARAGFAVRDIPEAHICCGSAGTYNILQPEIATALRDRKVDNIRKVAPDIIATGNIGCIVQIGQATSIPIVHTVELLDWASGGPAPRALHGWKQDRSHSSDPQRADLQSITVP